MVYKRWQQGRDISNRAPRRRQPLSCNTVTPGHTPVWRLVSTLPSLAGLRYHTHHIAWVWHLLTLICLGPWKMDLVRNIFLTTTPSERLWSSGSPLLVTICTSASHRLITHHWRIHITNGGDNVGRLRFLAETLLYHVVLLYFCICCSFHLKKKNRSHCFWSYPRIFCVSYGVHSNQEPAHHPTRYACFKIITPSAV